MNGQLVSGEAQQTAQHLRVLDRHTESGQRRRLRMLPVWTVESE